MLLSVCCCLCAAPTEYSDAASCPTLPHTTPHTQLWMNSYPEGMHGLPDSKFTAPDTLRKFTEHCAACAQGATSAIYMNSDALRV